MADRNNRTESEELNGYTEDGVKFVKLFNVFDWKGAKRSAKVDRPKKVFDTPQRLWALACQYFEFTEYNPIRKHDFIRSGVMAGKAIYTYHPRPFTWVGFEAFLWVRGVCATLEPYRENREGRYSDYVEVIRSIGNVMKSQKYDGAAVGLFKETIIMRDLYPSLPKNDFNGATGEENGATGGNYPAPVINVYYDKAPPLSNSEEEVDTEREEDEVKEIKNKIGKAIKGTDFDLLNS